MPFDEQCFIFYPGSEKVDQREGRTCCERVKGALIISLLLMMNSSLSCFTFFYL